MKGLRVGAVRDSAVLGVESLGCVLSIKASEVSGALVRNNFLVCNSPYSQFRLYP